MSEKDIPPKIKTRIIELLSIADDSLFEIKKILEKQAKNSTRKVKNNRRKYS